MAIELTVAQQQGGCATARQLHAATFGSPEPQTTDHGFCRSNIPRWRLRSESRHRRRSLVLEWQPSYSASLTISILRWSVPIAWASVCLMRHWSSFASRLKNMPQTTEAECLAIRRVGQTLFRQALLEYWSGRCPLTGITDEALLRASHIVAWADCETDALRLDVHNGLLLSALWDAAFDAGLISFSDGGEVLISPQLSASARVALDVRGRSLARLTDAHRANLARHRAKYEY